jgi:hypothetical protein
VKTDGWNLLQTNSGFGAAGLTLLWEPISPERGAAIAEADQELRAAVLELRQALSGVQNNLWKVSDLVRQYDDKQRAVRALIAAGDGIQADRETYRKRAAAIVTHFLLTH